MLSVFFFPPFQVNRIEIIIFSENEKKKYRSCLQNTTNIIGIEKKISSHLLFVFLYCPFF